MTVRTMQSGKHPIIVRLTEEEYAQVKAAAYKADCTPNEWMARVSVEKASQGRKDKK